MSIFHLLLGLCPHDRVSRIWKWRREPSYQVCLDCGRKRLYELGQKPGKWVREFNCVQPRQKVFVLESER